MKWKNLSIDIGEVNPNVELNIIFEPLIDINDISEIKPSCGCNVPKIKNNKLYISYTPSEIPYHLLERGYYEINKTISVIYKNGEIDILSFSGKCKCKNK